LKRCVSAFSSFLTSRFGFPDPLFQCQYIRVYDLALTSRRRRLGLPRFIPPPSSLSASFSGDDDDLSSRPPPPPFLPLLRRKLEHPVSVPHIAHGGHDRASGSDGVAYLLAEELKRREDAEEVAQERKRVRRDEEG
jgi:hypothetical protein